MRVPTQDINPEMGRSLLRHLGVVRHLGGALLVEKKKNYGLCRAYSVGKPDFEYHDYLPESNAKVAERKRLRVVERWIDTDRSYGVVSVQMLHVYRGRREASDVDRLSEAVTAYVQSENLAGVVLEEPRSLSDISVRKRLFLGFMSNGRVVGKLLSREVDTHPYTEGSPSEHYVDMAHYYAERPFFEEDYRYSTPHDFDLSDTLEYVTDFIREERQLASLRSALQG